jgi:hypothetical protein
VCCKYSCNHRGGNLARAISNFSLLPARVVAAIPSDNASEFAFHYIFADLLWVSADFSDPYSFIPAGNKRIRH